MITIDSIILNSNQSTSSGSHQILVSSQDSFLVFMTASNSGVTIVSQLNGVNFINAINYTGTAQMTTWVFPNPPPGMQTFTYTISVTGVTYALLSLSGVAKSETTYNTLGVSFGSSANNFMSTTINSPEPNSLILDFLTNLSGNNPTSPFPNQTAYVLDPINGAFLSYQYGYGPNTVTGWNFTGTTNGGEDYIAIALPPARSASVWNPNVNFRNRQDIINAQGLNTKAQATYPTQVGAFSPVYFQNSFLQTIGRGPGLSAPTTFTASATPPMGGSSVTIDYIQNIGDHTSTTFNYQIPIFSQDEILVVVVNTGVVTTVNTITFNGVTIPLALTYNPSGSSTKNFYVMLNPPVGVYTLNIVTSTSNNLISAIVLGGVAKNSTNFNTATAETASGTNVNTVISAPEAGSFILSMGGDTNNAPLPYAEQTILAYDFTQDCVIDFRYGQGNVVLGYNGASAELTMAAIAFPPARANSIWQPTVSLRNSLDIIGASNVQGLDLGANQTNISYGPVVSPFFQNSFLHTVGRQALSSLTPASAGPLANGLLAYWAFDEFGSTNVINDALNQFPGFWVGAASNPYISNGKINSAANLTGTNNALFPASPMLNGVTIPAISVSLWINQGDVITQNQYYFYVNSGGTTVAIKISTTGNGFRVNFDTPSGGVSNFNSSTSTVQGRWYHVVLIYNGSQLYLYVNGTLDTGPNAVAGTLLLGNTNFYIGSGGGVNLAQNAYVDEVGVWLRALTPDEVIELYNNGQGFAFPFVANNENIGVGLSGYNPYSQGQRYSWQTSFLQTIGRTQFTSSSVASSSYVPTLLLLGVG